MDINLDNIAVDLYGKLETRFPEVKIGDEHGEVLSKEEDIPNARFFEFPYKVNGVLKGTITVKLDQKKGIVLQVGGDLVDSDVPGIFNFIRSMGRFANSRLLKFKIVNLEKSNLDKRDYEFQATRKEEPIMASVTPVMESKFYGTSKISYQDLGEARLVIKHTQPVNDDLAAGRTMHIESIYVENADGERFKYPYKHLNGARALAEHLKHGGNPYDGIGKHITGLSEELACLRKFKGYMGRNEALAEAMGDIPSKVMERIEQVKEQVQKLQRKAYYEEFAESFEEGNEQIIPEDMMNDWVDRLTIRSFNEDLKSAFPYIYKLVSEGDIPVRELTPDDLLAEKAPKGWEGTVKAMKKHTEIDNPYALANYMKNKGMKSHKKESVEDSFESFINSITENEVEQNGQNTLFSPNKSVQQAAIEKLNQIMASDLMGGPGGVNAIESLKGIIDDPEFLSMLKDVDPDLDTRPLVQQYVLHHAPDVAVHLQFGGGETGGEQPVAAAELLAPPPPEAAPAEVPPEAMAAAPAEVPAEQPAPAPVAESDGSRSPFSKIRARFIKARECGADLGTKIDFGNREMTLRDAISECGLTPMECGFESDEEGEVLDGHQQMEQMVNSFWNREEDNFPLGGTKVKQKIVKAFKDGEFPGVSPDDVKAVLVRIEEMDPSSSERNNLTKLAGVQQHDTDIDTHDHRPDAMGAKLSQMDPLVRIIQLTR